MVQVLLIVMPVFLVVGAGYGGVRAGYLRHELSDYLNVYAIRIAVPCLLFKAMSGVDFQAAFNGLLLTSFYAGAFVNFILAIVLSRVIFHRRPGESVSVGFTAMFSNTIMIGVPIAERAYGSSVLAPAFGIVALHVPLLYIVGVATMELSRRDGRPVGETAVRMLRTILANPFMIAIVSGLTFNMIGISIPSPLQATIDMLAASAIPVALVGIGCTMARFRLNAEITESLSVSVLSLLLHPLIAFLLAYGVFRLPPDLVRAAVLLAAMPPGANGYFFAKLYDRATALSASAMLIATTLSVLAITLWLLMLDHVLPG